MHDHLTTGGWFFMLLAWGGIIALNVFCFYVIMRDSQEDIVDPMPEELDRDK